MAQTVKVIEQCQISPPPGSVPSTSIPLTFLDLPWLCCPPIKRIFLYEFPYSTQYFFQTFLPTLKHSLSLTLQHFFPFSANLVFPPKPNKPHILYSHDDCISFTVVESTADFTKLVSDSPRDVKDLHPFVPLLPSSRTLEDGTFLFPLMAIQVTVMSNSAFSICITFSHVVADGRAFHHFMKFWASICKSKGDLAFLEGSLSLPLHNRNIIDDPISLKPIFSEELWNLSLQNLNSKGLIHDVPSDMVRHMIVLSHDHIEKLKRWVSVRCKSHDPATLHITTFVVTCSLIWVCKVKSEEIKDGIILPNNDESYVLTFVADCRNRPQLSTQLEYFGNCLVSGNVVLKRSTLVAGNGILEAAIAIGSKVRYMQCEIFEGAETLMSNLTEFDKLGQHVTVIAGSPKLEVYETDFGWGKPKRSEVVNVEISGTISFSDCRDEEGKIEVGLALQKIQMKKFCTILQEQLREIAIL
ncbi:coumaroyl-CoA:anthocyanidin 3-O-glucoside-6''-O-coumaroyltransferase 1-like [Abrus precatorius]|uniref:Coumaroyl-CoA:anthocyanidin 3-O-glucoside-6''-O-coumaroyltransferase 1-like n=1 Tax=Abrus precatorius TaxID=3816 RepID=A0A8B8KZ26_ABRPR|nr:coumaroyl-CoA:anthocyanidin 3-O-glucoside-6''-O-coumaroyltransferase 1-like [Abrus precatorius]